MEKDQLLYDITTSFGISDLKSEETKDGILTLIVAEQRTIELLKHLKYKLEKPFKMLYDLTAIDMRAVRNSIYGSSRFT